MYRSLGKYYLPDIKNDFESIVIIILTQGQKNRAMKEKRAQKHILVSIDTQLNNKGLTIERERNIWKKVKLNTYFAQKSS